MKVSFISRRSLTYLGWVCQVARLRGMAKRRGNIPFLAGNDFPEYFLSCALAGTKITYQVLFCTLAPRGGSKDACAGVGHLRVRRSRADGTRIRGECGASGSGLCSLDRDWGERGRGGCGRF